MDYRPKIHIYRKTHIEGEQKCTRINTKFKKVFHLFQPMLKQGLRIHPHLIIRHHNIITGFRLLRGYNCMPLTHVGHSVPLP